MNPQAAQTYYIDLIFLFLCAIDIASVYSFHTHR
jgi:hypothetical protein